MKEKSEVLKERKSDGSLMRNENGMTAQCKSNLMFGNWRGRCRDRSGKVRKILKCVITAMQPTIRTTWQLKD